MPAPIPTAPLARLFRTFDAMVVLLRRCRNGSAAGFSELSRAWWPPTLAELDRGLPLRKKSGRTLFASPPRCGLALRLPKIKRQDEITCRRPDTLVLTHRVSKNHGPTEDVTGWAGCKAASYSQRRSSPSIFASTCSCTPCVFRRASQGPQGRVVYPSGRPGGARQDLTDGSAAPVTYLLQSAARRPGRVPGFTGAFHHRRTPCICVWV
jgi:hypothetical protein